MKTKHTLAMAAAVTLWLCPPPPADQARAAEGPDPQRQSLTIPITVPAGRSIECVVPFGPCLPISAVAFSPDGKSLAVGGYQEVLLWDLAGAKLAKRLGAGKLSGPVRAVAFGKEGKLLAVGDGDPQVSGAVRIFDLESGELAHSFQQPKDVVHSLAFSPDGKLLAAAGAYAPVHVYNMDEKKLAATIEGHADWVMDVSFSVDGTLLATAGTDKTLRVWKVEGWESVIHFVQKEAVRGGLFLADGKTLLLAVGGPTDRGIRVRRTDNARYNRSFYTPVGTPLGMAWVAKGNRLYVAGSDHTVKALDSNNGRLLTTYSGHGDWVYGVAVSADGTRVASGSGDGTVKLFNSADGKLLATLVQLAPRAQQWLIVTDQGYLAASSPGELTWNTSNVQTPAAEITGLLEKPDLVQKVIAGEKTEPPALK